MKNPKKSSRKNTRKSLLPAILGSLFGIAVSDMTVAQAKNGQINPTGATGATPESMENADAVSPSRILPPDYDAYLIMQGKQVYEQLLTAREGALNKNKAELLAGLDLAKQSVEKLQLPDQLIALDKQLDIIKQDLDDKNTTLDGGLWVPVEAQLRSAMAFSSDDIITPLLKKTRQGQKATKNNDHKQASSVFHEIVLASRYNLGIFPLTQVRQDINSALQSANSGPFWSGADEAIQSALTSFHWYSKIPSQGLLSAYRDVVNAYSLSLAPQTRANQAQAVDNQLTKAIVELKKVPDTSVLQAQLQKLIDQVKPSFVDIKLGNRGYTGKNPYSATTGTGQVL